MSAPILRKGDVIHLAIPYGNGEAPTSVEEGQRQAQEMAERLASNYAAMGVTVAFWNASNALTYPIVVAVFREYA